MSERARRERSRPTMLSRWLFFGGGGGGARGGAAALGAVATVLVLCGCESTQQQSARLHAHAKHEVLASQGVSVSKENPSVKVVESAVVHSREGTAVVVALRNTSSHPLENAPIEITVRDAHRETIFQNNAPGLEPSLTTVSLLKPGAEAIWIDDQVQAAGTPASASALVGEAPPATSTPALSVSGTHLSTEAGTTIMSGSVTNGSATAQQNLVVDAVARRGSKIVAAGRAVLPEVTPHASVAFQIYFVGNPNGAQITTSAPPTSF